MTAIIVMGVCGTGKTTVGEGAAKELSCPFLEGDHFHPQENVEKMRAGIRLDDDDRWPWLERLGQEIGKQAAGDRLVIAACSALKRSYRDRLRVIVGEDVFFILLDGDAQLIRTRMSARNDHYMPPTLLDSQLAILERPQEDERSMSFDVADNPVDLIARIASAISAFRDGSHVQDS